MRTTVVILLSFAVGAIPFSYMVAQSVAGADLRQVGSGTVSGTGLYQVTGFVPLVLGGLLDVFKGVIGPLLSGGGTLLMAFAAAVTVIGHNWSPFIGGAGGRGLSPALGAFLVISWPATLFLLAGLALGRVLNHTGLVVFLTMLGLPFFLIGVGGEHDVLAGCLVVLPILIKRVWGNQPLPAPNRSRVAAHRLIFDNDG